jgi:hypothetical protein
VFFTLSTPLNPYSPNGFRYFYASVDNIENL